MRVNESELRKWVEMGLVHPDALGDLAPTVRLVTAEGFPQPVAEYRFHPRRRFRFDLAWPDSLVAFEREGGKFQVVRCACGRKRTVFVSRHHSRLGMERDAFKYNLAASLNWVVIRATPAMVKNFEAASFLIDALKMRGVKS